MKRSDMHPGLAVELQRGRDCPTFTEHVLVVDTRRWYLWSPYGNREARFATPERPAGVELAAGIPVAVRRPIVQRDDQGRHVWVNDDDESEDAEVVTLGYEWVPSLVPAAQIVPVGTRASYEAEHAEAAARRDAADAERRAREAALSDRVGTSVSVRRGAATLLVATLEAILDERDRLRAAVATAAEGLIGDEQYVDLRAVLDAALPDPSE